MTQHPRLDTAFPSQKAEIVITENDLGLVVGSETAADTGCIVITPDEVERTSARVRLSEILTPNVLILVAQLLTGTRFQSLRSLLLGAAIWRTIRRNLRRK